MVIDRYSNMFVIVNGKPVKVDHGEIHNVLPDKSLYTGSITEQNNLNSSYVFNLVSFEQLMHIIDKVKNDIGLSEVKIEVETHDANAKTIQPKSIRKHML